MDRESLERNVNAHIERVVTRAFDLAPARAALGTADRARTAGNASFRAGDFTMAIEAYSQGMVVLRRDATHEPVTMAAAERALLALLANSAQCALKLGDHQSAIDLATDALGIHACPSEPGLFKKLMVRLALARDAAGDTDAAIATCEEAQLRGMHATEFDDIMRAAKRTNLGALQDGQEPRMFVMLGLRLSNGAENLARIRGVVENGQLPHVDRRDEGGNNILWGTLQALAIDESTNEKLAGAGGPGCVPTLAYLYAAGADPCQRYEGGKTPLMFVAGSGIVDAVVATLEAMRSRRKALNAEVPGSNPTGDTSTNPPGDASSIAEWVDVADDGGWTPLMVSLMTKDEASTGVATEEEGHAVLKVVRELLDAGANPGLQNVDGNSPLHLAAMAGYSEPACEILRRSSDPAALLALRNTHGMSPVMVARRVAPNSGVVADLMSAAEKCGASTVLELEEDLRVCKWEAAVGKVGEANNAAIERIAKTDGPHLLNTPWAEQECVYAKCDAWLGMCNFDELPDKNDETSDETDRSIKKPLSVRAFEAYGDVYAALHTKISGELLPRCVNKRLDVNTPGTTPTEADCARLWYISGGDRPADEIEKQPPAKFVPHLGGCVANPRCVAWHDLVGSVLPHSFAFAVPSEAALSAIEALKRPIVEMGAGTGYWTALMRRRGVDVVAYDRYPPTTITKDFVKGRAKFFGVRYVDDVNECDGSGTCLESHADRVLMLCWPRSPEDVEGGDWDLACLDAWKGDTLVHIGEWSVDVDETVETVDADDDDPFAEVKAPRCSEEWPRGTVALKHPHGFTTSAGFQRKVQKEFERVNTVQLPNWPFARDDLTVWRRR